VFCDAGAEVAKEGSEEEQGEPADDGYNLGWLAGTLTALSAVLIFAYSVANDHLPESSSGIVVVDSIFLVLATIFILVLNRQLVEEGRRGFLRGPRSLFFVVVVIFAVVAGVLAGLAPTGGNAASTGSGTYARHLREEIRKLQSAGGLAPSNYAGSRSAYAEEAQALSVIYEEVVSDLRLLQVAEGDRATHRRLVHHLAAVGRAYEHLGAIAAERSASQAELDVARQQVKVAMEDVRSAEEQLDRRGYRILLPPADRSSPTNQ
jgi:hypothetical protein